MDKFAEKSARLKFYKGTKNINNYYIKLELSILNPEAPDYVATTIRKSERFYGAEQRNNQWDHQNAETEIRMQETEIRIKDQDKNGEDKYKNKGDQNENEGDQDENGEMMTK